MKRVFYERARILNAPPEIMACLWSNWEIYDAILGKKFGIRRLSEAEWVGEYFWRFTVSLVSRDASLDAGRFVFVVKGSLMGFPAVSVVTSTYVRLSSEKTAVLGTFENELTSSMALLEPLVRGKIHRMLDVGIEGGQIASERISKEYGRLRNELATTHTATIDSYIDIAKRLRFKPFENPLLYPSASPPQPDGVFVQEDADIRSAQDRVNKLASKIGPLASEIRSSIELSQTDPGKGLAHNRRIAEVVAKELLKRELGYVPNAIFGRQLGEFKNKAKGIPPVIFAHMNTVWEFGNDRIPALKKVTTADYGVSLNALLFILEWYALEYLRFSA